MSVYTSSTMLPKVQVGDSALHSGSMEAKSDANSTCSSSTRPSDDDVSPLDYFERQRLEIARWIAISINNKGADPDKVHKACRALVQHTFTQVAEARKRGPSPITNRTMLRPGDNLTRAAN